MDASALLLLVQHPDVDARSEVARRVLPEASAVGEIVAPALLAWEVGNVVFVKRAADWAEPDAQEDDFATVVENVRLVTPDEAALRATAALARRHGVSFYDAAYLELAARGDAWLVTEDERLLKAARRELGKARALDLGALGRAVEA